MARKWIDTEGVDVIVDVIGSAVAFAVQNLAAEKKRVMLNVGSGAADLTGQGLHAGGRPMGLGHLFVRRQRGKTMVKRGIDTFFFITVDYAFGQRCSATSTGIEQAGGKVVGGVRHPLGHGGLLVLPAAGPGIERQGHRLANAGHDTANTVKQGAEFGIRKAGQEFAGSVEAREVRAIGLEAAQGLMAPVPATGT